MSGCDIQSGTDASRRSWPSESWRSGRMSGSRKNRRRRRPEGLVTSTRDRSRATSYVLLKLPAPFIAWHPSACRRRAGAAEGAEGEVAMFGLTALELARIQFGFTMASHIIFPAITIGLASYLVALEGLWLWKKD